MNLRLADNLSLPLKVVHEKFAFLGKTGSGKTYCAGDLAEEMLKAQVPIVYIDPMSIAWGLQVDRDGRSKGYDIVVFGGEHANLPLDVEKAEELAQAIVATNISVVLDVSDLSHAALQKFMTPFLNELYRINREDRHVFIEEADVIAPQQPQRNETVLLGAVNNFVRRGGNRNLGTTLISQRSAIVAKNILTQTDYLVVLQTTAPQDKKAVAAWAVKRTSKKAEVDAWLDSLDSLDPGEAYVWGPDMNLPGLRVKFRERETFHATRENLKQAEKIKPMDVSEFIAKYQAFFKTEPVGHAAMYEHDKKLVESMAKMERDMGLGPPKKEISPVVKTSGRVSRSDSGGSNPPSPTDDYSAFEAAAKALEELLN